MRKGVILISMETQAKIYQPCLKTVGHGRGWFNLLKKDSFFIPFLTHLEKKVTEGLNKEPRDTASLRAHDICFSPTKPTAQEHSLNQLWYFIFMVHYVKAHYRYAVKSDSS